MSTTITDTHRENVIARGIARINATDTRLPHDARRAGWLVIRPMCEDRRGGVPVAFGVVSQHATRDEAVDAAARQGIGAQAQGGYSRDMIAEVVS